MPSNRFPVWLTLLLLLVNPGAMAAETEVNCPALTATPPQVERAKVYADYPFKAGEESKYELRYSALKTLVGYGYIRVYPPLMHPIVVGEKDGKPIEEKRHHMVFQAEGFTGDWYKLIFVAHDKVQAFSRPWDMGISKFYMKQDEDKPFSRHYKKEKWLDFNQFKCQVTEKTVDNSKEKDNEKVETIPVSHGAIDALGALFKLRSLEYKIGTPQRFLVYTSEKNWWLEAHPLAFEKVTVTAGTYDTVKLSLKTFLGQELQQKGDVFVWIATKDPSHPMVKVEGEVTFGNIYLSLESFKPGK